MLEILLNRKFSLKLKYIFKIKNILKKQIKYDAFKCENRSKNQTL